MQQLIDCQVMAKTLVVFPCQFRRLLMTEMVVVLLKLLLLCMTSFAVKHIA